MYGKSQLHTFLIGNIVPLRLIALIVILLATLLLNLCMGEINLHPAAALAVLMEPGDSAHPMVHAQVSQGVQQMLWQIRIPRLLTASIVGCALGTSGYLLQALSRNYLADPYLTGVSSGAALVVALIMLTGTSFALMPLAALGGGLVAALVVAVLARTASGLSISRLLLAGIAVSAICNSFITLIMTRFAEGAKVQGLFYWLAGSVSGRTWSELEPVGVYVLLAIIAALLLSKPLRVLSLGEQAAGSLGVNVPVIQWAILVTAVILCGAAVSLSGIVGFVGLVAPYIGRNMLGNDERLHILGSACLGAIMVALSDLCARCLIPGQELPLGTLLNLVGAPFFLWLVARHRSEAV